jgi:hypothetical protein
MIKATVKTTVNKVEKVVTVEEPVKTVVLELDIETARRLYHLACMTITIPDAVEGCKDTYYQRPRGQVQDVLSQLSCALSSQLGSRLKPWTDNK